ncbi:hypothetical protein ACT4ML_05450 [Natrinema sp. LN54]|uniref:hypothetical protein n=1 Tax=Natrinema sp. LN54 TaxID=3458705 RepID=UPI00403681B4
MRVRSYIYDGETAPAHVDAVLERLSDRKESVDRLDVSAAADRDDAVREAMLRVRESVRIGTSPDGIYDEDGNPDFSAGVLIAQEPTGRRSLFVGEVALKALADDAETETGDGTAGRADADKR